MARTMSLRNPHAQSPIVLEDLEKRPSTAMGDSKMDALSTNRRSQDKVFVMEYEETQRGPGRKRFLKWWLTKKQWWMAVIICILLVLLVILLVIFFGIVPGIFQSNLDKVKLSINYMDIKSMPTDATTNKMDVELSIRIDADASASSRIDETPVTLYYLGRPFSAVSLPEQKIAKGKSSFDLVLRDMAEISDVAVFRSLSKALVTDKNVTVSGRAEVRAHAMGLSYGGLKLNRDFTIKAFNQFQDPMPVYNNITLSACSSTSYKMLINVTLDNVAQVGIGGIGALNLSVYYKQGYLGQAISTDSSLGIPRGATPMELQLTIEKSTKVLSAMGAMLQGMLASDAQFYVSGNNPYATQAPLLSDALAQLNMSMPYKDGLSKVTLNPQCDLASLLALATGSGTTS